MSLFAQLAEHDFGELHLRRDSASGLLAIVAIHDTRLGPSLGGCRCIEYDNEGDAIRDALRLARGMTYKAALAGVPHGGGKSVIIRPRVAYDRSLLFRAFGRFVEDLGGRYISAEDSGTSLEDMEVMRGVTRFVTGVDQRHGGSEACVRFALGKDTLEGVHVAVQGVGHVGMHLCRELHAHGATLSVADVDPLKAERAAREFGANVVSLEAIFETACDVFAPCALGSALSDQTIPRLRCRIVAGAANNQLAEARHGDSLRQRGIVYAPDYAINAGGLINVAQEVAGYDEASVRSRTLRIYDTTLEILQRAARAECATSRIADAMVEERLFAVQGAPVWARAANDGQ